MNVPPTTTPGTAVLSLRDPFPSRFPANILALAYCRAVAAKPTTEQLPCSPSPLVHPDNALCGALLEFPVPGSCRPCRCLLPLGHVELANHTRDHRGRDHVCGCGGRWDVYDPADDPTGETANG